MARLRGLSLFANVGVAESGVEELEDFEMLLANEIDHKRCLFYRAVHPNTKMIEGDITEDSVRDAIVKEANDLGVNFILATPPCQGMSEAGLRKEFDKRNELIYYAIDVIKRVSPLYVIIENVPKILTTKIYYNGRIVTIPEYLNMELGGEYRFNQNTLIKSMDYGVPQMRERNIYLLAHKSCCTEWEFPNSTSPLSLEQAIGHLPSLDPLLREGLEQTLKVFPDFLRKKELGESISKWHTPPTHSWRQVEWMMHTPTGKSAIYNEIHYPKKEDGTAISAHHNNYRRMCWDKPARTMTQNNGVISSLACVHPGRPYKKGEEILYSDPRVLTIYELLIVSSLPTDWSIPLWASDTFIRRVIGEGIPPRIITQAVKELIKDI